ncbi:MAG: hypothetical protein DCC75_09955 [Proteobacteria bacterium]|nr:MAG: hypothetical protein DCC75_09955 [Pseudomonadota bacterium]
MTKPLEKQISPFSGFTSKALAKAIFQAEVPEEFIRQLPPQSMLMVIKHNGLASSSDLVELATLEQCRLLIDFDCWRGDLFSEEAFWEWLSLSDDENGLRILQKIVKCIDLKLVSLLIARYVEVKTFENPTDTPPAPGFYTPDKGHSWILIKLEDPTKHFLLARMLALIFETNADLYYQLLSAPLVATESVLEEDSFQERNKRLSAEGVPDPEWAAAINQPLQIAQIKRALEESPKRPVIENISAVHPLIYDSSLDSPLGQLFGEQNRREVLESELTLLMNAAIVRFKIDFYDAAAVRLLSQKVKGALNIGLEIITAETKCREAQSAYEALGLQKIYALGLGRLLSLRKQALDAKHKPDFEGSDAWTQTVIEMLSNPFPDAPWSLLEEPPPQEKLDQTPRAILSLSEMRRVEEFLSKIKS